MSARQPIHILLMEEHTGHARLARRALERAGYAVDLAYDGDSGLAMYAAARHDLLIVDHRTPGGDGLEVLHALAAKGPLPPVIMVTGHGDEKLAVEALHLGVSNYVIKDVEGGYLMLLPALIERALQQRHLEEQKRQAEEALHHAYEQLDLQVQERTAALAERDARTRAILDTAVEGIITIDEHGIIETFNAAAERLFGYSAAEAIGQNVALLMPPPYSVEHDNYIARYLQTGEKRIIGIGREVTGKRQDGSIFPMDLAISEVNLGTRRWFTGFVRDLSRRKRAEQEMQRADRLALVGQLASGLAHEIGTPLNVIAGNAELLRLDLRQHGIALSGLDTIVEQADRITRLIERLLTFARTKEQPAELLSLETPLASALRLLETRFRREAITVLVEAPADLPVACGAADQLEQVFLNVLVNAWHAMPGGGTITITASPTTDNQVQISFRDTGTGMSAAQLTRAFEPFFSTKGDQGTGLGLAICKQIIEAHRGTIRLDSTLGVGTTVTLTLPGAPSTEEIARYQG
jgi:two-component system, LuxR family, sensor kinase FixL